MVKLGQDSLLTVIASWASIIAFFLTLCTFVLLMRIKAKFLFRSSIDSYKNDLLKISNKINTLLNDFEKNAYDVNEEIAIVDVKLRTIEKYAKDNLVADVKKVRSKIKVYNREKFLFIKTKNNKTESAAREIKLLIVTIIHELDIVKKEINVGVQ